jgi:hypothetical protein
MKMRTVLSVLIVVMMLMTITGSTASQARASTTASSALSGGQYVLTIQTSAVTHPTGYRLSNATTTVDPAPGCCCKTNLPCVLRQ